MRLFLVALFIIAAPLNAFAGGTDFRVQLHSILWEGSDTFKIELEFLETTSLADVTAGEKIIVSLRYKPAGMFQKHLNRSSVTEQDYREAINKLLRRYQMKQPFSFGLMISGGLTPIRGSPGNYQSNALKIIEGVVYSFE